MTDILERAKAVDPEMLAVLNWGALRDLISELIAEVEAKQANNEYLQKMTEEAQGIMQESQLLLCKEANEAEQLQNEVERLRSENNDCLHERVKWFNYSLSRQLTICSQKEEIAAKDARIKELEEANRNIDKRRDEMAAFIERLEAAFLKARQCPTCKGEGTIHPIGQPIDSICPKCLGDPESMAREALERIKEGKG